MIIPVGEIARVERVAGLCNAAVAEPLALLEPRLSPTAMPLAGGHLVLLGPGMYVNRGLALGLGLETTADDLAALEASSRAAGVPAEVEVSPLAHPSLLERTAGRGYRPAGFRSTLLGAPGTEHPTLADIVTVQEVSDDVGLAEWQAIAAAGFGYTTDDQRRISDLYAIAIHLLEQTRLYLARMGGRPVAVASLTIRDDVAILGGMTTIPFARGRGVQAELIRFRLDAAAKAGCAIAISTAEPGSASERNLLRRGFSVAYTTLTVRRTA